MKRPAILVRGLMACTVAVAVFCVVSCPAPGGGGGGGGGGTTTTSSMTFYSTTGSSGTTVPVGYFESSSGRKAYLLGTCTAGVVSSLDGIITELPDGGQTVFLHGSADGSLAYIYGKDATGAQQPIVAKVSVPAAGDTASLLFYSVDWSTGASTLLLSVPMDETGVKTAVSLRAHAHARSARQTEDEPTVDELETSFNNAWLTFVECRTHLVIDLVYSIAETIKAKLPDSRVASFLENLKILSDGGKEIDGAVASSGFTTSKKATDEELAAANQDVQGFESLPAGGSIRDNANACIKKIAGDAQTGAKSMPLTDQIQVIVVDNNLLPQSGVAVEFEPVVGGAKQTLTTDANGYAYYSWTLGLSTGTQFLEARIAGIGAFDGGITQVLFSATAEEDHNYIRCKVNGVAATTVSSPIYGSSMYKQLMDWYDYKTYRIGGALSFSGKTTGYNYDYISIPEHPNGTYAYSSEEPYLVDVNFELIGAVATFLGVTPNAYTTYGCLAKDWTITAYEDSTKYWGTFHGHLRADDYNPLTSPTVEVTEGSFMFLK